MRWCSDEHACVGSQRLLIPWLSSDTDVSWKTFSNLLKAIGNRHVENVPHVFPGFCRKHLLTLPELTASGFVAGGSSVDGF